MKNNNILILPLLYLNSLDIPYLISFKLNYNPGIVYIVTTSISFIFLYGLFGRYTYRNLSMFLFLILYFVFQFFNGIHNAIEPIYSFVTFISYALTIYLVQIFNNLDTQVLFSMLKKIFYSTLALYIALDIFSIMLTGKSQHVQLSNILPFLVITYIIISITEEQKKRLVHPALKYLICFVIWIFISIFVYTSDQRLQLKAISLSAMIFILFYSIKRFLPTLKKKTSLIIGIPIFITLGTVTFIFMLSLLLNYLNVNTFEERGTSLFLREGVASAMLQDINNASDFNYLFGYGLGSSMKLFSVDFGTTPILLRSHSGFLSLLYEHGLISYLLFVIVLVRFFFKSNVAYGSIKNNRKSIYIVILALLFFSWVFLNTIYLIAINVPNYAHQTQLILVLLLAVYLNKMVFRK